MSKRLEVWENAFSSENCKSSAQIVRERDEAEEIPGCGTRNLKTVCWNPIWSFYYGMTLPRMTCLHENPGDFFQNAQPISWENTLDCKWA